METRLSAAEELPALYRTILDGIAELERRGNRREAAFVRAEATEIYSTSWDDTGRRRLIAIVVRINRINAGLERPRVDAARSGMRARRAAARAVTHSPR